MSQAADIYEMQLTFRFPTRCPKKYATKSGRIALCCSLCVSQALGVLLCVCECVFAYMHKIALVITVFSFLQCANIASPGLGPLTQHGTARHGVSKRHKADHLISLVLNFWTISFVFYSALSLCLSVCSLVYCECVDIALRCYPLTARFV